MARQGSVLSERGKARRVIVVGGGSAGLSAAIKLCEANVPVLLFSVEPARRSHSVCAQSGVSAALDTKGEGDSPWLHMQDTLLAGDFLAHQPPVLAMAEAAPGIVGLLDRMGVAFNRSPEGLVELRRSEGSRYRRTAYAGASTGQLLIQALDEQLRRFEMVDLRDDRGLTVPGEKLALRHELWEFLGLVLDDSGVAVGIVAQDLRSMKIKAFAADAVVLASGGYAHAFGGSSASLSCTGGAAARVVRQGAVFANPEFVQLHPTAVPAGDKLRALGEGVRGEGGRLWLPKDPRDKRRATQIPEKERDYLLERAFPGLGNLVPADLAARCLLQAFAEGRGIFDAESGEVGAQAYLDVSHRDPRELRRKLGSALELYDRVMGDDPHLNPMRVTPALHATLGGLWVDYETGNDGRLLAGSARNQATNIPGLYAAGEVDYQYHGANRLEANALLSHVFAGFSAASAIVSYRKAMARSAHDLPGSLFEKAESREQERYDALLESDGNGENVWALHQELGECMLLHCGAVRDDAGIDAALAKIDAIAERSRGARIGDRSSSYNQSAQFARQLADMLLLARLTAESARRRAESRGTHHKSSGRDDASWLRSTLLRQRADGSAQFLESFDYECAGQRVHVTDAVDTRLVEPAQRRYDRSGNKG